ncbi:hypothetical protein MYP_454 [Sporocytophaga myxococcoides]|uniref:Uncharacterized protein n=1 Tax=Sporocytophaga myxococcoides TaxID=153721 RepID=A0A098LAP7_9BACT|nr:hypothetical protein MYP_454 [Sporocytophaga myxococcoides]
MSVVCRVLISLIILYDIYPIPDIKSNIVAQIQSIDKKSVRSYFPAVEKDQ